jgi:hypothetical protein
MRSVLAVGPGFFPLDDELALLPGSLTPSLAESLVRLGSEIPSFGRAASLLEHFTKVRVAEATVRRRTEAAGAAYVAVQTAVADQVEREVPASPTAPAVLQLSVDGAMVPLLHGQWAEVKTLAAGCVVAQPDPAGALVVRTGDLSYFSRLADHETFRRLAWGELHRRGIERAGRVVGVVDGSDWCQGFFDYHRPDAVRILDFPHALEHLAAAGQAVFGTGTERFTGWLDQQAHTWKHGDPVEVLGGLCLLPVAAARDPEQAAAVQERTLDYLAKRWEQVQYAHFQAQGLPIGSGMVESANKLVVEFRLKGSGMHWARKHVNPMVALRTALCSGRWTEAWEQIAQQVRQQVQHTAGVRRAQRRASRSVLQAETAPEEAVPRAPSAAAVPPDAPATAGPAPVRGEGQSAAASAPKVLNGKPRADHPWRRPLVTSRRAS